MMIHYNRLLEYSKINVNIVPQDWPLKPEIASLQYSSAWL